MKDLSMLLLHTPDCAADRGHYSDIRKNRTGKQQEKPRQITCHATGKDALRRQVDVMQTFSGHASL
jgi:hypothetical protein